MTLTFIETNAFAGRREQCFGNDDSFRAFQNMLLIDPDAGDVIHGCGGMRKVRWSDAKRGKGKRGGLRVIYLHIPEISVIALFAVYDKDEATDLTPDQKRIVTTTAAVIREELISASQSRKGSKN